MEKEKTIENLAKILHNAWRKKKIREDRWHTPKDCPSEKRGWGTCRDCHSCVNKWDKLTEKEKELPLMNAKLSFDYFKKRIKNASNIYGK